MTNFRIELGRLKAFVFTGFFLIAPVAFAADLDLPQIFKQARGPRVKSELKLGKRWTCVQYVRDWEHPEDPNFYPGPFPPVSPYLFEEALLLRNGQAVRGFKDIPVEDLYDPSPVEYVATVAGLLSERDHHTGHYENYVRVLGDGRLVSEYSGPKEQARNFNKKVKAVRAIANPELYVLSYQLCSMQE